MLHLLYMLILLVMRILLVYYTDINIFRMYAIVAASLYRRTNVNSSRKIAIFDRRQLLSQQLFNELLFTGVFNCTLSGEYKHVADAFQLSIQDLWRFSVNSIEYIAEGEEVKQQLRLLWEELKPAGL